MALGCTLRPGGLLWLWIAAVACGTEGPPTAPFQVVRVQPPLAEGEEDPELVYLNQEITVRFNRPVDPLSVTESTVRVTDEQGQLVKGVLRQQGHSVTFEPVAPLEPALDDGSFKPGARYRLEVAGFPRAGAVRSADGEILDRTLVRRFQAVPADHQPSPLLHAPTSPLGFAIEEGMLHMAEDSRTLTLYFHEPPLPSTVTPQAFKLYHPRRVGGQVEFTSFEPKSAKLLRLPASHPGLPQWLVELELDRLPGGYLCVELVADPDVAITDYAGGPPRRVMSRPPEAPRIAEALGQKLVVEVFPGQRVPVLRLDFKKETVFRSEPGALGFEVRSGRAVPRVRAEAGTGRLGSFAPRTSTVLAPGVAFDRGDGQWVSSPGPEFDFLDVDVPAGVTVRVQSGGAPIRIRACGDIRIDGELVLEGSPSGLALASADDVPARQIVDAAGVALVAGGDIVVRGRIDQQPGPAAGAPRSSSPLTLLCAGDIWLIGGRVPAGIILATEPGQRVHGEARSGVIPVSAAPMTAQLPPGTPLRAAAVTEWLPLPVTHHRRFEVETSDVRGDLSLEVQIAPPDAAVPDRPAADAVSAPVALPLGSPLAVPPGSFVRFRLEARLEPGAALPSVGGVTVVGI